MSNGWVYTHIEFNRVSGATRHSITPLKAKCQADALEEGKELWRERLRDCDDVEGAKRLEYGGGFFWPSKPKVRLEISISTDPL